MEDKFHDMLHNMQLSDQENCSLYRAQKFAEQHDLGDVEGCRKYPIKMFKLNLIWTFVALNLHH